MFAPLSSAAPAADYHSIDPEQDDSADDGHDDAGALTRLVPAERAAQPATDECTGNTKQNGDDETARILSGHDELRERANDETNDESSKNIHDRCSDS